MHNRLLLQYTRLLIITKSIIYPFWHIYFTAVTGLVCFAVWFSVIFIGQHSRVTNGSQTLQTLFSMKIYAE